jgi:hypothetical protein
MRQRGDSCNAFGLGSPPRTRRPSRSGPAHPPATIVPMSPRPISAAFRNVAPFVAAGAVVLLGLPPGAEAQYLSAPEVQYPFVCTTAQHGLGQPLVDNQDRQGIPVAREAADGSYPQDSRGYPTGDAEIVGWSRDCEVEVQYRYYYLTEGGQWEWVDRLADVPTSGLARTTTTEGREVPMIARMERGTINRFIYSIAMLVDRSESDPRQPDNSLWNGRLLYSLQGGVAIGRTQGSWSQSAALSDEALRLGYAVVNSTGLRTNTHYNLLRGGQTAVMIKDHFVATHGDPLYTVAVGGSGGAIQQYVYQQNHPGLFDGGVPQYAYPDMLTQTIHIGDCELLEFYFERTDAQNPRWRNIDERTRVLGLNAEQRPVLSSGDRAQFNQLYQQFAALGIPTPEGWNNDDVVPLTECRPGWFGLTPVTLNPHFTTVRDIDKLAEDISNVHWTHWDDARDVYGVDERGWARTTWDNVGVQYGLDALRDGAITPEEFLHLNAFVGGWRHPSEMVPPGCPFVTARCLDPAQFDPWSSRQMNLSPDGATPAPRTQGDVVAIRNAWENGHVFRGHLNIPIIDWRHYLEHQLDMHNTHQSFAARQRIEHRMGHHRNQLVWFTDARPGAPEANHTGDALEVLHEWITNIRSNPAGGVDGNRPASAVDRCWTTDGTLIAEGDDVWGGILDDRPAGACTRAFELHSTSRIRAGAPISGDVFKCQTMPVRTAVTRGVYGGWRPDVAEIRRLEEIFPSGVCDYGLRGVGEP